MGTRSQGDDETTSGLAITGCARVKPAACVNSVVLHSTLDRGIEVGFGLGAIFKAAGGLRRLNIRKRTSELSSLVTAMGQKRSSAVL